MTYRPRPIGAGAVTLSPELNALTERLAESAHDSWALMRLAEGWVRGPVRDDAEKRHPNLVPYMDLSESDKDYDRLMALETLRTLVAMGYRIVKEP